MKVLIIGGGASGMMAALSALENPNNTVTLLERQSRVGKKLLATGNGRCNLTNRNIRLSHYHGEQPEFARFALESFYVGRTLAFFERLGLLTVTEDSGKVYPLSDQASSVLDVLRFALEAQGANIVTSCDIVEVKHKARGYEALSATGETYFGDKLIIACGGAAGKKLGGSKSGYHLLEQLGHSTTALFPSLTQIKTDPTYVKALKGVRADAHVQLRKDGETLQDSFGEVQFTDFGLSGPEAFTLSRMAATGGEGQELALDFFREYGDSVLLDMLQEKREKLPELAAEDLFAGMLQSRLGRMIVKRAGLKYQTKLKELTDEQLLFCDDPDELPVVVRPALGSDALELVRIAQGIGLGISERTAHRILAGQIEPCKTLLSKIVPEKPAVQKNVDIYRDSRGLKVSREDLGQFSRSLESSFRDLAEKYYLDLKDHPKIRVSKDSISVKFEIEKEL